MRQGGEKGETHVDYRIKRKKHQTEHPQGIHPSLGIPQLLLMEGLSCDLT